MTLGFCCLPFFSFFAGNQFFESFCLFDVCFSVFASWHLEFAVYPSSHFLLDLHPFMFAFPDFEPCPLLFNSPMPWKVVQVMFPNSSWFLGPKKLPHNFFMDKERVGSHLGFRSALIFFLYWFSFHEAWVINLLLVPSFFLQYVQLLIIFCFLV